MINFPSIFLIQKANVHLRNMIKFMNKEHNALFCINKKNKTVLINALD